MTNEAWKKILVSVEEIQDWFPDGVVFIGGIAVYAHAFDDERTPSMAAFSQDADFMILLSDFAYLRDIEELTPNRKLTKQQFFKNECVFDAYVEGQNDLPVPADEAVSFSVMRAGIRVACLEHLVILKTKAFIGRKGTLKGNKDEDDLVRTIFQLSNPDPEALSRLTSFDVGQLEEALNNNAFLRVSNGSGYLVENIKSECLKNFALVANIVGSSSQKDCANDLPEP